MYIYWQNLHPTTEHYLERIGKVVKPKDCPDFVNARRLSMNIKHIKMEVLGGWVAPRFSIDTKPGCTNLE